MKRRCLTVLLARILWSQLFVKVEILWILHEGFDTKPECEKARDVYLAAWAPFVMPIGSMPHRRHNWRVLPQPSDFQTVLCSQNCYPSRTPRFVEGRKPSNFYTALGSTSSAGKDVFGQNSLSGTGRICHKWAIVLRSVSYRPKTFAMTVMIVRPTAKPATA
jgi:hypothetical protein